MSSINSRLREERTKNNWTQKYAADLAGVSLITQQRYEKEGGRVPDAGYLQLVWKNYDVPYIITGVSTASPDRIEEEAYTYLARSDFNQVPLYKAKASAGHGITPTGSHDMSTLSFPKLWFEKRNLNASNLFAIDVEGDSMEPLIPDGSVVLCDKTDVIPVNDKIYVFDFDGDLLIKKIIRGNNGYIAVSKNPSYPNPLVIDETTQSRIIGRARRALPDIKL